MLNCQREPGSLSAHSWPTLLLLSKKVCTHWPRKTLRKLLTTSYQKESGLKESSTEKKTPCKKNYVSVADAESPLEDESHYIFAVKTTAPEFDLVDCYPSDSWMIKNEAMHLSMDDSGTSGCILFQKKTTRERFAVTLGVHAWVPWGDIATNFREETPQEIRDSYYGKGKRNVPSVTNRSRYISKPLSAGRSVDVIFVEEVDKKKRYPTEIIVK